MIATEIGERGLDMKLFPVTLEDEACPIDWRTPSGVPTDFDLGLSKSRGRRKVLSKNSLVEVSHELGRCGVVNSPKAGQNSGGTSS